MVPGVADEMGMYRADAPFISSSRALMKRDLPTLAAPTTNVSRPLRSIEIAFLGIKS